MAEFIEVTLDQETYKLDLFWLRDHCRCEICYDHENHQRKSSLKDIQADISMEHVKEFSLIDGNNLEVICKLMLSCFMVCEYVNNPQIISHDKGRMSTNLFSRRVSLSASIRVRISKRRLKKKSYGIMCRVSSFFHHAISQCVTTWQVSTKPCNYKQIHCQNVYYFRSSH